MARHGVETAGREGFELHSREGYGVNKVLIFTCHGAPLKVRSLLNRGVQRRALLRPQYVDCGPSIGDACRPALRPLRHPDSGPIVRFGLEAVRQSKTVLRARRSDF